MSSNSLKENRNKRLLVRRSISILILTFDLLAMIAAFYVSAIMAQELKEAFFYDEYAKAFSVYIEARKYLFASLTICVLFMLFIKGHYTQRVPWWNQVQYIGKVILLAFILDGFIHFALHISFSRLLITSNWIFAFAFILMARQLVYLITRNHGIWSIPTVIIGDVHSTTNILCAFQADRYTGYSAHTVFLRDGNPQNFDLEQLPKKYHDLKIEDGRNDFINYIKNNPDNFYVICLETFRGPERIEIINTLTHLNILHAVVPPLSRVNSYEMEPRYFFGYDIMLLHAKSAVSSLFGRSIKRGMDITLASISLLPAAPIIAIVSILIKLEGQGGSIFYSGERIGRHGKHFRCWKFRTMEPNSDHLLEDLLKSDPKVKSEWEKYHKIKNDPRIKSRTSRLIRKTSIDELPQLWNVLKGDMSMVGPRPILESEKEKYGDTLNLYLSVRPGITGLWQVSGRNATSFQRRVYWDSWYVRNWSLWGDIVILIRTLRVVLGGSGAY